MFLITYLLDKGEINIESQINCYLPSQIINLRFYLLSWFIQNGKELK